MPCMKSRHALPLQILILKSIGILHLLTVWLELGSSILHIKV
jgi:hypothetical protein